MANASDGELLRRWRDGEESALDQICARYEGPLFQFLLGLLRVHHLAEEALQDTFVRALERLEGVDPEHLRGWLFTVAYHQAMLARRKEKPRPTLREEHVRRTLDPRPGPAQIAEQRDDARRVRELLNRLPVSQREVIRQRVEEDRRFRDIAADLNCPLNTALSRMHEGLKRLRSLWERDHA